MRKKYIGLLLFFLSFQAGAQTTTDRDLRFLSDGIILMGAGPSYYLENVNTLLELKKENNGVYSNEKLFSHFDLYIEALFRNNIYTLNGDTFSEKQLIDKYGDRIKEAIEKFGFKKKKIEPFKILKEINKYSQYFSENKQVHKLNYFRMKASYFDKNYFAASMIGEDLIKAYNSNKIINSISRFSEGIEMAKVYKYVISSSLMINKDAKALELSKVCLNNKNLQFSRFLEFYAHSLFRSNQKIEACSILNKAYLNGNERAKDFIKEYCQ